MTLPTDHERLGTSQLSTVPQRRMWTRWRRLPSALIGAGGCVLALLLGVSDADPGRPPRAVCDEPVHDFGSVVQGTVVRHVFRLRNEGDTALRITEGTAPCGCTAVVLPDAPVAPGDDGGVEISFDTSRFRGPKTKSVVVYTNDPIQPVQQLTVTGTVTADVVADPAVLYLGRLHPGTNPVAEIRIVSTSGKLLDVVVAAAEHPSLHLAVEPLPGSRNAGRRIVVSMDPSMPRGSFNDTVRIAVTGPDHVEMEVPVFGTVERDLVVQPSHLTMGGRRLGRRHHLRLRNRGLEPITVEGVRVLDLPLDYAVRTVSPGYEYQITLRLAGPVETTRPRGMVHIYTTHPDEPEVVVPIYAMVRPGAG